jgi:D-alanyl-D-alanine carboxypeptidase
VTPATLDSGGPPQQRGQIAAALLLVIVLVLPQAARPATVTQPAVNHLGSLVVDLGSNRILHAYNANRPLVPASLTKLMSAYVLLEALAAGEVAAQARWRVSAGAARQPPSRFGFREGETVSVETALRAMIVASGNDAAMVVAEGVAGSVSAFAGRMNEAARRLGMKRSVFRNASGLPAPGQRSSARDMAVLARALWQRFPERAGLFSLTSVEFSGRRRGTTNGFISSYRGANGMKTGFTCRAGYNLVGSVQRARRHLIGVVMGAPTPAQRTRSMRSLMDRALSGGMQSASIRSLDELGAETSAADALPLPGTIVARACLEPRQRRQEPRRWTVDIGIERTYTDARKTAQAFIRRWRPRLRGAAALVIPRYTGVDLFRAGITGLHQEVARDTCLRFRKEGGHCIIMDTPVARAQLEDARRVQRLSALHAKRVAAMRSATGASAGIEDTRKAQ